MSDEAKTISQIFQVHAPAVRTYTAVTEGLANPELVIGLELETENVDMSPERYNNVIAPFNYQAKADGSLRGDSAEFVSLPMRSDHALAATAALLKWTKFGPANYSDRCSVHVHVNCTNFTAEQVSGIALVYSVMEDTFFEYVGQERENNIYCIPWNQCRNHLSLVHNFLSNSADVLRRWQKYTALNLIPLNNYGTIEFRHMHGTADMNRIGQWVNMIGALVKYGSNTELNNLIAEIKSLNSTSEYEAFFNRVMQGTLPYNETYRQKLEEGIIFAKFTLMGKGRNKVEAQAPAVPRRYAANLMRGGTQAGLVMAQNTRPVQPQPQIIQNTAAQFYIVNYDGGQYQFQTPRAAEQFATFITRGWPVQAAVNEARHADHEQVNFEVAMVNEAQNGVLGMRPLDIEGMMRNQAINQVDEVAPIRAEEVADRITRAREAQHRVMEALARLDMANRDEPDFDEAIDNEELN